MLVVVRCCGFRSCLYNNRRLILATSQSGGGIKTVAFDPNGSGRPAGAPRSPTPLSSFLRSISGGEGGVVTASRSINGGTVT